MKILIFYGPGTSEINKRILQIKKQYDPLEVTEVDAEAISWEKILLDLVSKQLFSDKRLIIIENFSANIDLSSLAKDSNITLLLKTDKTLSPSSLILKSAHLLKAQISNFKEEKEVSIFPFLDALAQKDQKAYLELEKLYQEYGSQYIITMIYYMLRRLILTPKNLPPALIKRLEKQKQNFPLEKIRDFYKEVIRVDFKIKLGLIESKLGLVNLITTFLATS